MAQLKGSCRWYAHHAATALLLSIDTGLELELESACLAGSACTAAGIPATVYQRHGLCC